MRIRNPGYKAHLGEDVLEEAGEEDLLAGLDEVRVEGDGVARLVVHREPSQLVLRSVFIIRACQKYIRCTRQDRNI